ncbi:MAG: glycerophosphodiester phosphodiesterase family protein [Paracoccaceae bacterium]|nr:glycerophosphodiester phosphodiesterase family protein [Paracoccaceae bacterium]
MMQLPAAFRTTPIAHRALHDIVAGRPENSLSAVRAAVAAGYGIEIDLQLTKDGHPVVFHDYDLNRLTGETGPVQQRTLSEMQALTLLHGSEGPPSLPQVLDAVAGKVPLLIELKDQDGGLGPNVGPLEQETAQLLVGYAGPVAVMSFNPHSVAKMQEFAPATPRGLTTEHFPAEDWQLVPEATRTRLRDIPDFDRTGSCFISHDVNDLTNPRVTELKAAGVPILCWTVKSESQETEARRIADNITFENYRATLPSD